MYTLVFIVYLKTKTYYCASRCRFTIAISSLPVLRMHALLCEFCFSLGFYHCHFTVAICLCAVSYALTTIHSHTILLPAAVLPFQFEQCLLKRYAFDVLQIRSHMHLLSLPTKYCASRWGFTIAILFVDFWIEGQARPGLSLADESVDNCKMVMVKPEREAYLGTDFARFCKICASAPRHRFCKLLQNLCQYTWAQILQNFAKSVPVYMGTDLARFCEIW